MNRNQKIWLGLLAGLLLLAGCKSLKKEKEKEPEPKTSPRSQYSILVEPGKAVIPEPAADSARAIAADTVKLPDSPPSSQGEIARREKNVSPGAATGPADTTDIAAKLLGPNNDPIKVEINFDAAPLTDIMPAFAQALNFQYLLDPEIKGTITMTVDAEMKRREVWALFEQILWMTGSYCALEGKVLHLRPLAKIAQERRMLRSGSNVEVQLVQLHHLAAKDAVQQLKPFLSETGTVNPLEGQNALLLVESPENLARLLGLIDLLDRRSRQDWPYVIIPCSKISAAQIQQELMDILPVLGFPVSDNDKNNDPGAIQLSCLSRTQLIVASAATPEPLEELKKWVATLDRADTGEQERVFIYKVINGKADELMQTLSVIFPTEGTALAAPQGNSSTSNVQQLNSSNQNKTPAAATKNLKTNNSGPEKNSIFDIPVKAFADGVHNRLVIRTTPRTYGMIHALLERLDTIPAQVLLQVLVVEIELNDNTSYGMEFSNTFTAGSSKSVYGTNYQSLVPGNAKEYGGRYYIFNPDNPEQQFGYIKALAGKTKMKVLSSPQILATSHMQAKISVGKQVPIISDEITDTQSTTPSNTSLRRSYQYQDTGIILEITPHITEGGLISMEMDQVISEAIDNTTEGIDSPIIKKDELKTTLALRNGHTIIMGGLIKEKLNEKLNSVPFLVDIPVLNYLTGDSTNSVERTEILVMVTANIISE
ncbi:MAG: secretin N-terminal domain-containing protein, partial [Victivallales bacterium]|nr:secretin N-terminal domain-containing protein [Victivallales bacterium]